MDTGRRFLLTIITPLLPLFLFTTALDVGVLRTAGQPESVKKLLSESGVYDGVIPSLLNQQKNIITPNGSIPLTDSIVQQAASQSFSPQLIENNSNDIIDSLYAWLDGKTAEPQFKVDLSGAKTSFASDLAAQVNQKAANLPTCTTPYTSTSFDVFNATCIPPGVSPAAIAQSVQNDALSGRGFLDNPVIKSQDIKNNSNQSPFTSQFQQLPDKYQKLKKTPAALMILTLLCAVGIIFLSATRRKGLRHVGITLLVIGGVMLLLALAMDNNGKPRITSLINIKGNVVMTNKVRTVVGDIIGQVDRNYTQFGIVYGLLGAAALSAPLLVDARRGKRTPAMAPVASAQPEQTPPKPRPARRPPPKIQ